MATLKTLIYTVWTLTVFINCAAHLQESDCQIEDRIAPKLSSNFTLDLEEVSKNLAGISSSPLEKLLEKFSKKLASITTQNMPRIKRDTIGSKVIKKRAKKLISSSSRKFKLVINELERVLDKRIKTRFLSIFKDIIELIDEDSDKIAKEMTKINNRIIPVRDAQRSVRIINGKRAESGQFPWQVALYHRGKFLCGGSLISKEWVLTAAHCTSRGLKVYFGSLKLEDLEIVRQVTEFIMHPEYSSWTMANDIAVLKLNKPVTLSKEIQPISLAQTHLDGRKSVIVSGWGRTSDYSVKVSSTLMYVILKTITNSECARTYGRLIKDGMVCCAAGYPAKGTCHGDSGGPLVTSSGSSAVQVGIVSFVGSSGCGVGSPSGYTRIAYYRDWIKTKTGV